MKKEVSVKTVAKRMNRILAAYEEQVRENAVCATTSSFGQMTYSTERGLEVHKTILNFAANNETDVNVELDSSDQSYSLLESPPKRRSLRNRTSKRTGAKITAIPSKRSHRKVSHTVTSKSPIEQSVSSSKPPISLPLDESDDPDTVKSNKIVKTSPKVNENDIRKSIKGIKADA